MSLGEDDKLFPARVPIVFAASQLHAFLQARPAYRRHWVGLSGGLDSVVLLHALVSLQLPVPLTAVHVHHGLSPRADAWQRHCEALCRALDVPLRVERVGVERAGEGVEAAARRARYRVFADLLAEGDALLLAHHRDDQAETLLLRLLRASGPRGLGAMAPERDLGPGRLLRPLLEVGRADLQAYARDRDLAWVEDESNRDTRFDRNYLRHQVLPVLQQRWPEAPAQLSAAAGLCRDSEALLAELAGEDLARLHARPEDLGGSLALPGLAALSTSRRHNLLRHWLRGLDLPLPGAAHLQELEQQFFTAPLDGHGREVSWPGCRARVFSDRFYVLREPAFWRPHPATPALPWRDPQQPLRLPGGDSLCWQPAAPGEGLAANWCRDIEVRWRRGGERCHPAGRGHSQSLKKLLQEYRVPPWLRSRVPLLYAGEQLVAVADLWVCKGYGAPPGESGYRCKWHLQSAV